MKRTTQTITGVKFPEDRCRWKLQTGRECSTFSLRLDHKFVARGSVPTLERAYLVEVEAARPGGSLVAQQTSPKREFVSPFGDRYHLLERRQG